MTGVAWRKSSYSGGEGSSCVELAPGRMRDSKNQDGPVLTFPGGVLMAFVSSVKADRFTR